VLERLAYLNAGTDGPLPRRSAEAAAARMKRELHNGRSGFRHFVELAQMAEEIRTRVAALLGAETDEVALTRSTTDGINAVLAGLRLDRGAEVVTSDEEHPGLLAPLGRLRGEGIEVKVAPFAQVAEAVDSRTRLVAVSHVSWVSGRIAPLDALRATGAPMLLDGAQSLGAIPVDVHALGCDFFASAGQKWLCGPDGTGALYVRRDRIDDLGVPWPNYLNLADLTRPLELVPATAARRFDGGVAAGPLVAGWLESLRLLDDAPTGWVFDRARAGAARLRELMAGAATLVPGDETTLVTWQPPGVDDPQAALETVVRLASSGVVVRSFPDRPWVRASVGAWNSEDDFERLVGVARS
jgi:L-cysteine/cystine lyase